MRPKIGNLRDQLCQAPPVICRTNSIPRCDEPSPPRIPSTDLGRGRFTKGPPPVVCGLRGLPEMLSLVLLPVHCALIGLVRFARALPRTECDRTTRVIGRPLPVICGMSAVVVGNPPPVCWLFTGLALRDAAHPLPPVIWRRTGLADREGDDFGGESPPLGSLG
jgi:hypothetical protein